MPEKAFKELQAARDKWLDEIERPGPDWGRRTADALKAWHAAFNRWRRKDKRQSRKEKRL
jgi:hypothetical protein